MRITWIRDWLNLDPEKRKRIKGVQIQYGLYCRNAYQCNCSSKCKYRHSGVWFHNMSVGIRQFFQYRLHIKLPCPVYICKKSADLSGTVKCPFQKPRLYTCWDCQWCSCDVDGPCLHPDYNGTTKTYDNPDWGSHHRCVLFDPISGVKYDHNSGEIIY